MRMCYDNSFWGMQFRTCENFGESTDSSLVLSPKFSQIQKPHRHYFDCDSLHESATNLTQHCNISSLRGVENAEAIQKIAQPNLARFVVQKIGIKDTVVPSTDFLLESGKRGTPPKSEKRQLLARRGSGAGGAALLRKETSESNRQSGESNANCHNSTANLTQNFRHTERSEVSKSRESNQVQNAMTKERMGKSHRFAQSKKIVGDSRIAKMDSSLRTSCYAQNDESFVDCFGDESPRNDDIFNSTIRSRNHNA